MGGCKSQFEKTTASFRERLLDQLYDGVYFVDQERRITYWNKGAERLSGYSSEEALGRHCFNNFLRHRDEQGRALCLLGCPLAATMTDGQPRESEVYLLHKDGHRVPVTVRTSPVTDDAGAIIGAVEIFSDATERKRFQRRLGELEHLAFRDALTGLPNRRFTEAKVGQALDEHQNFGRRFGVLMIDVDHFKQVNDRHGHEAGDTVLQHVAQTLSRSFRNTDVVGRWGGEEFLVTVCDARPEMVRSLAERCRNVVAYSVIQVAGASITVTVSLGATLLQADDTFASLTRRADELMYRSKQEGRNRTTFG